MKKFCMTLVLGLLVASCGNPVGRRGFDAKPPGMDDARTTYSDSRTGASDEEDTDEEEVPEPYNPDPDSDILEISEKMFLTQINDIYYNFDEYKDKTIIVEGMYASFTTRDGNLKVPVIYRYGPGCCDNDGWGGFLLKYAGQLPQEKDWIRVTGTPELTKTPEGYTNLVLNVISIEMKTQRGKVRVTQ